MIDEKIILELNKTLIEEGSSLQYVPSYDNPKTYTLVNTDKFTTEGLPNHNYLFDNHVRSFLESKGVERVDLIQWINVLYVK